jgi:hypothetical protein
MSMLPDITAHGASFNKIGEVIEVSRNFEAIEVALKTSVRRLERRRANAETRLKTTESKVQCRWLS